MKLRIKYNYLLFSIIFSLVLSCDRPDCTNTNLIFKEHTPDSKAYKKELARQLDMVDKSQLTYWLQDYESINGKEILYFYIQGDGLCATLPLQMLHWNKLEDLQPKKGSGRFNAEFVNLKFDVVTDSTSTQFIYRSYDRIID